MKNASNSAETPTCIASASLPSVNRAMPRRSSTSTIQPGTATSSVSASSGQIGQKVPPISAQMTISSVAVPAEISASTVTACRRSALSSAFDIGTSSEDPTSSPVARRRESELIGPRRYAATASTATPIAATGSDSLKLSTWNSPTTLYESTQRYQIGTLASWTPQLTSASGTRATGQLSARCACCSQKNLPRSTASPRDQKPIPLVVAGGCTETPRSRRAA